MGAAGTRRWLVTSLGLVGLGLWVAATAWLTLNLTRAESVQASGPSLGKHAVSQVLPVTAEPLFLGQHRETIYFPSLGELGHSSCSLRDRPEVGERLQIVDDPDKGACAVGSFHRQLYNRGVADRGLVMGLLAAGLGLVVCSAKWSRPHQPEPMILEGGLAGLGLLLMVVAALLPWVFHYDEHFPVIEVSRVADMAIIHPFFVAGVALLLARLRGLGTSRIWRLGSALGAFGLFLYSQADDLTDASMSDTTAWSGPAIPIVAVGFLALWTAVAVRELSHLTVRATT